MARCSSASGGMILISVACLAFTGTIVISKLFSDWRWPYFHIMGILNAIVSIVGMFMIVYTGAPFPEAGVRKWIFLRGLFGATTFIAVMLAVQLGAPPGDVSALTSGNIVAAALLAYMFLKEPLHPAHAVSVICALSGSVLIAKPQFIFGQSSGDASPMLGYSFAVVAGFLQSGLFITSRIAGEVSVWYHILSSALLHSLGCALLPYTPLTEDYPLQPLADSFVLALILTCVLFLTFFMSLIMASAGAQLCPAAVSATLTTASSMAFGYLAQLFVFDEKPDALALGGAALMLAAVLVIALIQLSRPMKTRSLTEPPTELALPESGANSNADSSNISIATVGDDNESIASFVASEFVCFGASDDNESSPHLRHRASNASATSGKKKQVHLGSQIRAEAQIVGRLAFYS